jgi:hypothetical protein
MFASGPYKRLVPFVNLQEIRVDTNAETDKLNISLLVSNELTILPSQVKFSNYCILMSDRTKLEKLAHSPSELLEQIREDQDNSRSFILQKQDFNIKAPLSAAAGTSIYNNTYMVNRVVPQSKNLFALVVSYYHHDQTIILGNIIKETIMSAGETPSQSNIYRLMETVPGYGQEESIWPGAVHRHNEVLMAGNMHVAEKHPTLTKEVVINTKIKDMRVFNEAQAFSVVSVPLNTTTPYLSPLTLSRNVAGNVHGMFSFDHLTYARENTNFGRIIQSTVSLLSAAPIEDIIIYQKVVKEDTAGNSLTPGRPSRCTISEVSTFKQVASLNKGLQIVNGFNNNQILNIAFLDETTQDYEANMVEYKVEILLADRTKDAMSLVTNRLSRALSTWESSMDSASPGQLKRVIDSYLAAVAYLIGDTAFRTRAAISWQQNLLALVSGPQEDQLQVLELIRNFSVGVNEAMSPTRNITYGGPNFSSAIYNVNGDRAVRFIKTFSEKLQITHKKSIGFEYVDASILNDSAPMPSISYANMDSRVTAEIEKYAINNPNAGGINQYGYLTPTAVRLRANPIVVPSNTLQNSTMNFMGLIRSEAETNVSLSLEPGKTTSTNMIETLTQSGIGVTANTTDVVQVANNPQTVSLDSTDSDNYLPAGSGFATIDTPEETATTGSTDSIAVSNMASDRLGTSPLLRTMVNQTVTEFSNITGVANQANIAGSIALQKANEDISLILNSDSMTNLVNFGSIVQIQYLDQYDAAVGIKQQKWTLLTPEVYNAAVRSSNPLLCRLVLMSKTLDAPVVVNLQPLASLFVIGPEPTGVKFRTYRQTFQALLDNMSKSNAEALTYMNSSDILYATNIPMGKGNTPITSAGRPRTEMVSEDIVIGGAGY